MRIAIVHDWLMFYGGAERVLEQVLKIFPAADLYTIVDFLPKEQRAFLNGRPVKTSFVQHMPFVKNNYRHYLPLMTLGVEQFDMSEYDLVISSSFAVAKGVITGPDQVHVCICHSPMRYAWDLQQQYLKEAALNKGIRAFAAKCVLHYMRIWDHRTAAGVDSFVAISKYISRRILKAYRRESTVIYPPVDLDAFDLNESKEDFYLTASRMVPYKKVDLIVEAFAEMPDKKLIVVGDGPDWPKVKSKAKKNIELLGYQSLERLRALMQKSRAFIYAAEEDFGITPLEAQACGTPVIAFGRGALLETIRGMNHPRPSGIFFHTQSCDSLIKAVKDFEKISVLIEPRNCRNNALRFSKERFRKQFHEFVVKTIKEYSTLRF